MHLRTADIGTRSPEYALFSQSVKHNDTLGGQTDGLRQRLNGCLMMPRFGRYAWHAAAILAEKDLRERV
jgi:hypothetical protein